MKKLLSFTLIFFSLSTDAQIITTIAGNGTAWFNGDNIPALNAGIVPEDVAVDNSGNYYIADEENNRIRKVSTAGIITTIAGTGIAGFSGDNGPADTAQLNYPTGVKLDHKGNVYICDGYNYRVRKINSSGIITTIAGNGNGPFSGDNGPAIEAGMNPFEMAIDIHNNIYIVDCGNHRIRKIDTAGIITTVGGNGIHGYNGDSIAATTAELNYPRGVAIDAIGDVYIADGVNHRVRKVDTFGIITTFAGNGIAGNSGDDSLATNAKLDAVYSIAIDGYGNIYIADATIYSVVRKVNTAGIITTLAGNGTYGYSGDNGPAAVAQLNEPSGLAIDSSNNMYIADFQNGRIRLIKSILLVNTINNKMSMSLYPNPITAGYFTINVSGIVSGEMKVFITNITGEIVKKIETSANKPVDITFDAPAGIYLVTVLNDDEAVTKKIVIQ